MKIYDQNWHSFYATRTHASATEVLSYLNGIFHPSSLLEIGCGHGGWAAVALELAVPDVVGVDGPWTDTAKLKIGLEKFVPHDLATPLSLGRKFNMVLTLEVAEHVKESAADQFVESCTNHADLVVFGAAIPLQGGFRHINEQWPSYWIRKFSDVGYEFYDLVRPKFWNNEKVEYFYRQNTLVFVNRKNEEVSGQAVDASRLCAESMPTDYVHPEKYLEVAGYRSIDFRRLSKTALPILISKIGGRLWRRTV